MFLRRSLPASLLAGALTALAVSPFPEPWWIFVVPAALLWALEPEAGATLGPGKAILVGLVSGTTASLGVMYWMVDVFAVDTGFPRWLCWVLGSCIFLWHSGPYVVTALITSLVVRAGGRAWWVLPPALTVSFTVVGTLFPWRLAVGAVPFLPYVQMAELGSQPLVDLCIAFVGCGAVEAFRHRSGGGSWSGALAHRERAFRLPAAVSVAALLLPTVYGLVRIPMVEATRARGDRVRVGVVQPNIGLEAKHDPARADENLARLQRASAALEARQVDFTLWPESAYPRPFPRSVRVDLPGERSVAGRDLHAPIVFGAVTSAGGCNRWNSTLVLEDGRIRGVVDKSRLVPFTEFVPFWAYFPAIRAVVPCPGFRRGRVERLLSVGEHRIGVFNCYEDILASRAFRVGRLEPDFLVNVTNDAWFGDTREPFLHHQAARLRSIETRRDLVRAVNTGVSGHVSATGADLHVTETYVERSFVAEVRTGRGRTLFVWVGDWVTGASAFALLYVVWRALRARLLAFRERRRARAHAAERA
jgi:apolipoprotein N-acyltransferase